MLRRSRSECSFILRFLLCLVVLSDLSHAIDPVRPGDKIEVLYLGSWLPGEVQEYKKGQARVRYTFVTPTVGIFALDKMRFPNDEGTWMVWRDASGQFQVEARLIGRTQTHVKLRKVDGNTIEVPIAKLADSLRSKLEKVATREKEFVDAALVRIGDEVEVVSFSTWYPGIVKKISPTGAIVSYTDSFGKQEKEIEYAKMRYPNGEGPWADWLDSTGNHKIKARYITHDETHVELLAESGKRIRLAREKLADSIESQLALRPILTRRPDEVVFDMSKVDYQKIPSWTEFGSKSPELLSASLSLEVAAPDPTIHEMAMSKFPNNLGSIDLVVAAGGDDGWIAIGTSPVKDGPKKPASLHWFSTKSRTLQLGPQFFEGEVILGYSPDQKRLLTADGLDISGSATRFCSYRLSPGDRTAKAEWKWSVPKLSFFSSKNDLTAKFVGENRVLIGYGATATLFDLNNREALYAVPSTNAEIDLSPDGRYFCTNQFARMVVVETNTGQPVAKNDHYKSGHFSRDGRYLLSTSNFSGALFDIRNRTEVFPIAFQANPGVPQTLTGSPSSVGNQWFCDGQRLWDLKRKLLVWTYELQGLSRHTQTIVGDKLLTVATHYVQDQVNDLCISVINIPPATSISSIGDVSEEELYILRSGVNVKIDPSITDSKILNGLRRAMTAANWKEDPQSAIIIKASAKNGPSVSTTYSSSRFGGTGQETVSVEPWLQSLTIEYQSHPVWGTSQGGVPSIMVVREGTSLQQEAQKYAKPSYSLFDELTLPARVLSPKWKYGFGTTQITSSGLKDVLVAR